MDDLKDSLRPLLTQAPEPPPLADITDRVRRHRRRRRGLVAALAAVGCLAVLVTAVGIRSTRDTNVVAGPGPDADGSGPDASDEAPGREPASDDEQAPATTTAPPSSAPVPETTGPPPETSTTLSSTTTSAPPATRTTTIQDTQQGSTTGTVQFGGTWSPCTTTCNKVSDGSYRWTNTAGATATIRFSGSQITLYGVKEPWGRIATVSIDGGPPVDVDYYAATATSEAVAVYRSPTVADTTHTLVVTYTTRRNPASASNDAAITFDRAVVTGTT